MELVDRYLRMVKRYLPPAERDDIVAELAANLDAAIEDRARELGRPLGDAEREAILNAHGHPIAVALRYRPAGKSFTFGAELVGPALFPFYIRVLAANVVVACAIACVAAFYDIPTWIGAPNILSHLVLQFAIVTIVFASLQRYLEGRSRDWRGTRPVSRMGSVSTLVFLFVSNVWLADLVRSSDLFAPEAGGSIVLTPVWHQIVVPYLAIVALEIVRNGVNLFRPEMVRFRALTIASANVVALVAIAILLRAGSLVAAVNPADSQQLAAAHAIGAGILAALVATALGSAVAIAWQIRRLTILRNAPVLVAVAAIACALASSGFGPNSALAASSPSPSPSAALCAEGVGDFAPGSSSAHWNGWGASVTQSRFQPAAMAGLAADSVPNLKLQWAFGFLGVTRAYGQPTVFGGRVFVGSENGHVYALDANTGCIAWDFDAGAPVRTAVTVGEIGKRYAAYFGDQRASAYALDAATGKQIWKTHAEEHPAAVITGAPTLAQGKLFVPISSGEEGLAANPKYRCCTFRGGVAALDAATGTIVWKSFTVADPKLSGAAVWSAPTIDLERRAVYVATGDSYSDPAAPTSDALLAFDLDSGKLRWSRQMTANDAENVACGLPPPFDANCPKSNGPDFDFGASPILQTLPGGQRVLIAGQKSGMVYAVDPDRTGAVLWQTRVGLGSKLGGVQWGMAADAGVVYVAVSDVKTGPVAAGTAGAQPTAFGVSFGLDPAAGGGLFALDARSGAVRWKAPHPGCDGRPGCSPAQSAAVTAIPGIVFSGGLDGHLRAYAMADGTIVWDVDTERGFETVDGVPAHGGSIDGPGATIAGGTLYVNSGYAFLGTAPGNVLLAFRAPSR